MIQKIAKIMKMKTKQKKRLTTNTKQVKKSIAKMRMIMTHFRA